MKTHDELMKLTKVELEEYGRTLGVELDRRKKIDSLVTLLIDIQELCKPKKEESPKVEEKEEESCGFFAWLEGFFK